MRNRSLFGLIAFTVAVAALLVSPVGYVVGQGIIGVFQRGAPNAPAIFDATGGPAGEGIYFGVNRVGTNAHLEAGIPQSGNVPVLSACGTGVTAGDAGSTDTAGTVTNGGAATTCTITFGTAFTAVPTCIVSDLTATRASMVSTATNTAITVTAITASDKLAWICVAKSGG